MSIMPTLEDSNNLRALAKANLAKQLLTRGSMAPRSIDSTIDMLFYRKLYKYLSKQSPSWQMKWAKRTLHLFQEVAPPSAKLVKSIVCKVHGLHSSELSIKSRKRQYVEARVQIHAILTSIYSISGTVAMEFLSLERTTSYHYVKLHNGFFGDGSARSLRYARLWSEVMQQIRKTL